MKWPKKSRSLKRIAKRTPGGRNVIHLKQRKKGKAECALCHCALPGTSQSGSKTNKRPTRPYGGFLCSKCMRRTFIEKARAKA